MTALNTLLLASLFAVELPEPCAGPEDLARCPLWGQERPAQDDQAVLQGAQQAVSQLLHDLDLTARLQARVKTPDSLAAKALRKGIAPDQVLDRLALRVIVDDEPACDRVADALTACFPVVPGSRDDYIRNPKPNGYQSLHMALHAGPDDQIVEVQVRTTAMHHHAEHGAAAHHHYKARQTTSAAAPGTIAA